MPRPGDLLTLHDVSDLTGLEQSWLRRQVYSGRLQGTRVGRDWVVTRYHLEKWMQQRRDRGLEAPDPDE